MSTPSEAPSILFVNRVFPPQEGATGELLAELSDRLAARGWQVTVLASDAPGVPEETTTASGVRVVRTPRLPLLAGAETVKGSLLKRALGFAGLYPRLLVKALRLPRPDVIVTKTDPPLQLLLGPLLGRLRGARTVHWAQDLYPEVAEALGVLPRDGRLARVLRWLSRAALRRYDRVVVIGACMRERMLARGVAGARIAVVPNWALEGVRPVAPADNAFRQQHAAPGAFVVMYSGNMGRAHPFEAMLDAAERLLAACPDVQFLFVGDGARRGWIEAEVASRGLRNVKLLPFQPKERLGESLSAADLHLVSMEPALSGLVVPSKLYGVAAAGRPCVFLGPEDSEAARLLREHRFGDVLGAPTGEAVAEAILRWRHDEPGRVAAGQRAHVAAVEGRQHAFEAFDVLLRAVCADDTPPGTAA